MFDKQGESLPGIVDGKWAPGRSGCYDTDCRTGRDLADRLLTRIQRDENPALFGTVVRAITAEHKYEAVEIGFCSRIGIQLMV